MWDSCRKQKYLYSGMLIIGKFSKVLEKFVVRFILGMYANQKCTKLSNLLTYVILTVVDDDFYLFTACLRASIIFWYQAAVKKSCEFILTRIAFLAVDSLHSNSMYSYLAKKWFANILADIFFFIKKNICFKFCIWNL